jgi:(2R)-3-sulfolactate dehydrogenase (NADP+)
MTRIALDHLEQRVAQKLKRAGANGAMAQVGRQFRRRHAQPSRRRDRRSSATGRGRGMVGRGFSDSPAAMPAAGGRHPIFGTNPIAAVFARRDADPLLIDLSLSEVALGKLMVTAKEGGPIPPSWALDHDGNPTTDPAAGMQGSMLPIGAVSGPKGALLARIVQLLVTALIGANYGFEASSFFVAVGNRPGIGQAFIVTDPSALAGDSYFDRIEVLIDEMLKDDGVRLPGARREALRRRAFSDGIDVPDALDASVKT